MQPYDRASHAVTHHAARPAAVTALVVSVVVWVAWGVASDFSRPWELVVTCGVPIFTLFMVMVLQHAQNRDSKATHLKLNELLLALEEPDAGVVRARTLPDDELDQLTEAHRERADQQ
jgi:low affinity Fe/Cu permease